MKTKKKRVWLITWEWFSEIDNREPKIVAMLDPRYSKKTIEHMLHAFFLLGEPLTAKEKLHFGSSSQRKTLNLEQMKYDGLSFGLKPELYARKVDDLYIEDNNDGTETVTWTERAKYKPDGHGDLIEVLGERVKSWTSSPDMGF